MERERERDRERETFPCATMGERRKRRSEEDISAECNDQIFRPKRITAVPPFDVQRAESSRQHVRALNSQFASWVQTQLRDHPDELWQEGVQDYIKHASQILADFSDVVEWLKTNASSSTQNVVASFSRGVIPSVDKQVHEEDKKTEFSFQSGNESKKPGFTSPFTGPWSFGLNAASQSSPTLGLLARPPIPPIETEGASNDQEEGDIVDEPNSPSVKKSEEPGIVVVHEVKCKLYVKSENSADKGWKDMGMGQLYIKCKEDVSRGTKDAKATIVIRNDVGKVVLNALLYSNIKVNVQKNTITTIFHTADGEAPKGEVDGERKESAKARLYLMKLKSEDDAKKLEEAIITNAPAAE